MCYSKHMQYACAYTPDNGFEVYIAVRLCNAEIFIPVEDYKQVLLPLLLVSFDVEC
jgi:hypothetical protein